MNDEIDTTPVRCPDGCLRPAGFSRKVVTPRQFRWHDGSVGTRNYCSVCGAELVDAERDR